MGLNIMITIDQESRQRVMSPLDLDNMTSRFQTASGLYIFSAPDLWTLEKNLFYLLSNSTLVQFNSKYMYRPDYMSYDEYGTTQLAQLLMYVNSCACIEDFSLVQIAIPTMSAIVEILSDKITAPSNVALLPIVNY
jgi:hypothetical protein